MTDSVRLMEIDGSRNTEIEVKGDIVYIDSARSCYAFDRALFLRAIERAFDVVVCDLASVEIPPIDGLKDFSASPQV